MSRSCEEKFALMKSKQTSKARVHQKSTASWQRGTPGFVSSYENATVLRLSRENDLTNVPQRSSGSPPPPQYSIIIRGCLHVYIVLHDDVKVTPPQNLQPCTKVAGWTIHLATDWVLRDCKIEMLL